MKSLYECPEVVEPGFLTAPDYLHAGRARYPPGGSIGVLRVVRVRQQRLPT
jgi:hypothetical protein